MDLLDGGSTLFMEKPLEIYGDNNIGAYFLQLD